MFYLAHHVNAVTSRCLRNYGDTEWPRISTWHKIAG